MDSKVNQSSEPLDAHHVARSDVHFGRLLKVDRRMPRTEKRSALNKVNIFEESGDGLDLEGAYSI
jgi:hypothetical protein